MELLPLDAHVGLPQLPLLGRPVALEAGFAATVAGCVREELHLREPGPSEAHNQGTLVPAWHIVLTPGNVGLCFLAQVNRGCRS